MAVRLRTLVLFGLALAPSAMLAWRWRAMPHLGLHQDDALYLVGAKSLAEDRAYRIDSLPGEPFQTKYPPLLPALLAPVWQLGPPFPENLKPVTLFTWLLLPPCLLMLRATFRHFSLSPREVWLLTFAVAWHPLVCLLSTAIMSDLLFLTLMLGSLLLCGEPTAPASVSTANRRARLTIAGLLAGLAFLTRTVALPLLITVPLCFWYRKQRRQAFWFVAGMLPAVVGWQVWATVHQLSTRDPALIYYTSYLALERLIVNAGNLPVVLWHNFDALLRSFGKLLLFDVATVQNVHLERILGVAAIVGTVRLVRRTGRVQYPAAALGIAALLLAHMFTADERLSLPLYPLVLMGFWTEIKNFCRALRTTWIRRRLSDRLAAGGAGAGLAVVTLSVAAAYFMGDAVFLPNLYRTCERDLQTRQPAYQWIRSHAPPDATFYAYDDPDLYLYTGRRTLGLPMPPSRVYSGQDEREADRFVAAVPRQACGRGLDFLLITGSDFYRERRAGRLAVVAARDPALRKEFEAGSVAVYRCLR